MASTEPFSRRHAHELHRRLRALCTHGTCLRGSSALRARTRWSKYLCENYVIDSARSGVILPDELVSMCVPWQSERAFADPGAALMFKFTDRALRSCCEAFDDTLAPIELTEL